MARQRRRADYRSRPLDPIGREAAIILQIIRRRAAETFCGSTAAELARLTGSTTARTARILDQLNRSGWIAHDSQRSRWLPVEFVGILKRFGDHLDLVRTIAAADARTLPADVRPAVATARRLLDDARAETIGVRYACGTSLPTHKPPMEVPAGYDGRWRPGLRERA